MDPITWPLTVFTTDVGGGGGAPAPAATPADAANARIDAAVAAGMTDGDPDTGTPIAPADGQPPAEGTPPPEGAPPTDELDPDNLDFGHINYRDGKRLEQQIKAQRERFKPFVDTVGALPDDQREAALEALQTPDVLGFVHAMNPNDRQVLLGIYQQFLTDPAAGAEAFRALADQIAPAGAAPGSPTTPPAGAPPDGTPPADPDAPMTRAEFEAWNRQQADQAEQAKAEQAAVQTMYAEMKTLGYDPESSEPAKKDEADEVIWQAAHRTGGDLKAADAVLKARRQAIIDGYVKGKTADAATPGTPETGQSPSGSTPPGKVDPKAAMEARLESEYGPDPQARR